MNFKFGQINMMWSVVEYLKEPALVANVQEFFGVKRLSKLNGVGEKKDIKEYVVENKFWYYLFVIGTALGDEIFYASFIPFWFWNIDGAVGRRVVFVWTIVMYCGQGIKDIVKWPRPSYPVIRMQKKWAEEFGMPSTHAMVGVAIPLSVLLFTMNRYIYSFSFGVVLALLWCSVICVSRLYLGMHSVIDLVVGLILALLLMIPMVPLVDMLDNFWIFNPYSPVILLLVSVLATRYFPHTDVWTPTWGDTTMITSVCTGIHIGSWINYHVGNMTQYPFPPPYPILWPNSLMLGLTLLRTTIGFMFVLATRNTCKTISTRVLRAALGISEVCDEVAESKFKTFIELTRIFVTYFMIGLNTVFTIPIIFRLMSIERPTFYTEL